MKVIIKPFGFVVLLSAIVLLAVLAFRQKGLRQLPPVNATSPTSANPSPAPPPLPRDGNLLTNGDFEVGFIPCATDTKDKVAKVSGTVPRSWFDNSAWANITVRYDPDTTVFHTGESSQRVRLERAQMGHIQFAQILNVPTDRDYEVSAWVRASKPTKVTLAMRVGEKSLLSTKDLSTGSEWRQVSVKTFRRRLAKGEDNNTWVMLFLREPGVTYWIDDVKVLPLNNAVATK